MKPRPCFDPMFPADQRRWCCPLLWVAAAIVATAVSGLPSLAGPTPRQRRVAPLVPVAAPIPGGWIAAQGGGAIPQVEIAQPRDRFVIAAPAEIDPSMVLRARDDIDPKMVFNPDARQPVSTPNGRAPIIVSPGPGRAADQARPR